MKRKGKKTIKVMTLLTKVTLYFGTILTLAFAGEYFFRVDKNVVFCRIFLYSQNFFYFMFLNARQVSMIFFFFESPKLK